MLELLDPLAASVSLGGFAAKDAAIVHELWTLLNVYDVTAPTDDAVDCDVGDLVSAVRC